MVFFDGAIVSQSTGHQLTSPVLPAPLPLAATGPLPSSAVIGIRPEQIQIAPGAGPDGVTGRLLRRSIQIGGQYLLTLTVEGMDDQPFKAKVDHLLGGTLAPGSDLTITLPLSQITLFDTEGHRLPATFARQVPAARSTEARSPA
jgi:hypothetical protein